MSTGHATGRGVRIAVIDSGVNPDHPHIVSVAGGCAFGTPNHLAREPVAFLDRLGHGTAVMAAIQEKAPDAAYFAVRVFHEALRTTGATLVEAIDWCTDQGFDVVNLSLGSTNPAHEARFSAAASRADEAGMLLVSAREANGEKCFPGILPNVLSVALDWDCPRDAFRREMMDGQPVYIASGYPRPVPGVPLRRNLYGISFAVANMAGFVARVCEEIADRGDRRSRVAERLAQMSVQAQG